MEFEPIGEIIGGSLKEGLRVRLFVPPQEVQEGAFLVAEDNGWLFYGLVTDLRLRANDERFTDSRIFKPLKASLAELARSELLYTEAEMFPVLMQPTLEAYDASGGELPRHAMPVKTVPGHATPVRLAQAGDIDEIFKGDFIIGYTREQGYPVRINLETFVQRSAGIFGATGTGKSFLTRILLAGIIQHKTAATLVFDMHNEYAYDDKASDTEETVAGLQSKFGSRVLVVGLGKGAMIRGKRPDLDLVISERDITPEDILLLTRTLNLRETTATTLDALYHSFHDKWFTEFRKMRVGAMEEITDDNGKTRRVPAPDSVAAWANEAGVNWMAAEALHGKLGRVFNLPYIVEEPATDALRQIIDALENGRHVILSFGDHDKELDYLLVTNLITRKIREHWVKRTDDYRTGKSREKPTPLVVVVEEAHKLLNREMAAQTTFSTIARELRKYFVTLLIIDQRPSQIYDEVMSQLGTRISGKLSDEEDIRSVLSGQAARDQLRGMLSRLQEKEEVLILGWGVPMPLPIRSRRYDDRFWDELTSGKNDLPDIADPLTALFPYS